MSSILALPTAVEGVARAVADALSERGHAGYVVGGLVRDALLGVANGADLDLTTDAPPAGSRAALKAAGARAIFDVGERFGTIGGMFGDLKVEVTTFRAEAYEPGSRKPRVAFHSGLREDLARRDFTINAIAVDPRTDTVEDPFGGLRDLRDGVVRAVGNPVERFQEDPLRLLRAVRFTTRLGFQLEADTARAVSASAASLATISRERVRDELDKLLTSAAPARGVTLLVELGLAEQCLPELLQMRGMRQEAGRHKDVFNHTLQVLDRTPPRLALRWAALLHDVAKPATMRVHANGEVHFIGHDSRGEVMARRILAELKQPTDVIERAGRLVGLHLRANAYGADWTDGAVRRFVREAGDEYLVDLLALSRADVTSGRMERRAAIARSVSELEQRIEELRAQEDIARLDSPLDGNELMQLFERGPGAWIKAIKEPLREMVLDGALSMDDKQRATDIARELYAQLFESAAQTPSGPAAR